MGAETLLKAYRDVVEPRLAELLPSESTEPKRLHETMRYASLAPGKRLRPALCLASCKAVGSETSQALDAACAIEIVHCFSLVHDDLPAIDNDLLRRGIPSCHARFGEALALLAGDALFALAFAVLSSAQGPPDRVLEALRLLALASGSNGLVGGEVADVLSEGREVDEETLAYIHSRKTGALISASCAIGALMGGASAGEVHSLQRFGAHVGLAFQIADDILNETSTAEVLGKAAGSDRERSKATYPALHGIAGARQEALAQVDLAVAYLEAMPGPADHLAILARYAVERLR